MNKKKIINFEKYEKPDDCPICCKKLNVKKPLDCGHYCHKICVIKSGKGICPFCRANVTLTKKQTKKMQGYAEKYHAEQLEEEFNELQINATRDYILEIINAFQSASEEELVELLNSDCPIISKIIELFLESDSESELESEANEINEID